MRQNRQGWGNSRSSACFPQSQTQIGQRASCIFTWHNWALYKRLLFDLVIHKQELNEKFLASKKCILVCIPSCSCLRLLINQISIFRYCTYNLSTVLRTLSPCWTYLAWNINHDTRLGYEFRYLKLTFLSIGHIIGVGCNKSQSKERYPARSSAATLEM